MYQYLVKLQDMLSSPVMQMAMRVNRAFASMDSMQQKVLGGMQRGWQKVSQMFNKAGGSINDLKSKIEGLRKFRDGLDINLDSSKIKEANAQISTLERKLNRLQGQSSGGGFGRKAAGLVASIGGGLPGMLMAGGVWGAAAYGAIQSGQAIAQNTVAPAMQREATRFQLNELTNNPAFVKLLEQKFVGYAPEKMGELFAASQKLIGAGVEQGKLFDSIKMLNNLSAISNTKVDELAFIQSKIKATGYVQGDEMDMFRERGINLNPYLAKVLGVQENQVKKLQEKGLITYDKFAKALEMFVGPNSRFANVAERKRDSTSQGRYDFLMGQFNEKLTKMGERTLPMVNKVLEYTTSWFDRIAPLGEPILKLVGAFSPLFSSIGGLLKAMGILDSKNQVSAKYIAGLSAVIDVMSKVVFGVSWAIGKVVDAVSWFVEQLMNLPLMKFIGGAFGEISKRQEFKEGLEARRNERNSRLGDTQAKPDKNTSGNSKSIGEAAGLNATVEGARKQTTIINIGKFQDKLELHVQTLNEGVQLAESQLIDMLLRVANSAGAVS